VRKAAAPAALLLLGAAVHLAPEHLAEAGLGTQQALEIVAYGFDATVAWLVVTAMLARTAAWPVALWLAFESLQRGVCRVALPLHTKPPPNATLCESAFGTSIPSWLGLIVAALCAAYVWEVQRDAARQSTA
jgi:hypothetical protein